MAQNPSKPVAKLVPGPRYDPDLDAYGLRLEEGEIVPAVPCPDRNPVEIMRDPKCLVDARLWEGRFEHGRLRESRVTSRLDKTQLGQRITRLRESGPTDPFAAGGLGWPIMYGGTDGPLTQNYVPLIPGPATRQQYWADYWASSAKCFEASTHSGIARRACEAMVQFPLGRGVTWRIKDPAARDAWEKFWTGNRMDRRLRQIAYDLAVFGEQFLRYFPVSTRDKNKVLLVRQLDPATIYEIVTDQEDLETVYFYHQQFQTRMELYSPPAGNRAPQGPTPTGVTRYVIRQIDAGEIDQYKIHAVTGEARGRSDLFPALGDLKRLRDLMTSKVIQSDIGNRVMALLTADGTAADISRLLNSIFPGGQPPPPGSIVGLNKAASLDPFQYTSGREVRADFTYDELIDEICAAVGIARPYLGLAPAQGSGTTQAGALTNVEPSVKAFEERQQILDELLHDQFDRVMQAAGIGGVVEREFIFPEIAREDRSAKLADLETAESDGWISKRTAATSAAGELGLTEYDYDEELKQILAEFKDADDDGDGQKLRRPMIRAQSRQTPKLDPTKAQPDDDEPLGVLIGPDGKPVANGNANGNGNGQTAQKTAGGMPANKNPAAASNTIRETIRRRATDPEYLKHASEFEQQTAENLKRLIADITT